MSLTRRRTSYIKKTKKQSKTKSKMKYTKQSKTQYKKQKKTHRKNKTMKMYRKKIHGGNSDKIATVGTVEGVAVKFNPVVSSSDGAVRSLKEFEIHEDKLGSGLI